MEKPIFLILLTLPRQNCLFRHLGMLRDKSYKKRWDEKRANYESVGISETLGNLIITQDGLDGSLDAMLIQSKIKEWIENS